jgi:hypothetical protein
MSVAKRKTLRRKKRAAMGHEIFEHEFALERNKRFDSRLLISEIVWQAVSTDGSKAVPMGQVEVRGREQGIRVYQVA